MASTAPAKSQQTLNNFTLPFDLKWSTGKANAGGGGDSSNSNNNDGGASSGGGGGGRSRKRSMKYRDSSGKKVAAVAAAGVVVQDSVSFESKESFESEKVTSRNHRHHHHHHHHQHQHVFSVSGSSDRLIEKSEKRAAAVKEEVVEEKKVVMYHHSISKEKKVSVSDRLIEKSEKKVVASSPDRLFEKPEKKVHDSDRLVDALEKRSHRFIERLEKKGSVLDRLVEKSDKKATGSDRGIEKLEKKARVSDHLVAKSDKKAMATVHDRPVDTSGKKVMLFESWTEKKEEKLDGMDMKSKLLIRFKAKSKAEDGEEEGLQVVRGGGGGGSEGGEGDEMEVKTWNLRPRKPISKKMDVNGGSSMFNGGGVLIHESNKPLQLPQTGGGTSNKTRNETLRVRTHADAMIAQSSVKKSRITIPLSKEEIEEDIFVMTGSKPNRRPKKRARNVQKQLDSVFPGLWLSTISADAYKVSETIPKG